MTGQRKVRAPCCFHTALQQFDHGVRSVGPPVYGLYVFWIQRQSLRQMSQVKKCWKCNFGWTTLDRICKGARNNSLVLVRWLSIDPGVSTFKQEIQFSQTAWRWNLCSVNPKAVWNCKSVASSHCGTEVSAPFQYPIISTQIAAVDLASRCGTRVRRSFTD